MQKFTGELLSLLSSSIEVYERGIAKTYKKSIKTGILRYCIQTLAYALLGGINGVIITLMAIVRYLLMYRKRFAGKAIIAWVITSVAINVYFANTPIDLFPLVATLQFTLMAKKQNCVSLKNAQNVNTLIWSVYHIAHLTYVYLIFDIILLIAGFVRIRKGVED